MGFRCDLTTFFLFFNHLRGGNSPSRSKSGTNDRWVSQFSFFISFFPLSLLDIRIRFRGQQEKRAFWGSETGKTGLLHRGHAPRGPCRRQINEPVESTLSQPPRFALARLDPQRMIISHSYHHRRPFQPGRGSTGGSPREEEGINKNPTRTQHSRCRHESAREASGSSLPGLSLPSPIRSSHHDHAAIPLPVRLASLFSGFLLYHHPPFHAVDHSTASSSPLTFFSSSLLLLLR